MICHVLSWDVMRRAALRPSPPASPRHCSPIFLILFLHRVTFHPFRSSRRRPACGGSLFRAYRMCSRARVRAGAVCAPDCAREANAGRTSPVRSVGAFFAPARRAGRSGPTDTAWPCLILPQIFQCQALFRNYFKTGERITASGHGPVLPVANRFRSVRILHIRSSDPRSEHRERRGAEFITRLTTHPIARTIPLRTETADDDT